MCFTEVQGSIASPPLAPLTPKGLSSEECACMSHRAALGKGPPSLSQAPLGPGPWVTWKTQTCALIVTPLFLDSHFQQYILPQTSAATEKRKKRGIPFELA